MIDLRSAHEIETQVREEIRKEMLHFMKVEQYEPLEKSVWEEVEPIKAVLQDYSKYSSYARYYALNIRGLQMED